VKDHKTNEFGNKTSLAFTGKSGILIGAIRVEENAYDGPTLEPQLYQVNELTGGKIKKYRTGPIKV